MIFSESHNIKIAAAPRRGDRIVIVGGGPAGVHMAHLLHSRGHHHVTVLEADDRVGGKSRTPIVGDYPHELGTCYFNFTYERLIALLDELGRDDAVPVAPPLRTVAQAEQQGAIGVLTWLQNAMRDTAATPTGGPRTDEASMAEFVGAMAQYQRVLEGIHPPSTVNLPMAALPSASTAAAETVSQFFKRHSIDALEPIFLLYNALNGYGLSTHIPVYYGTYWTNPLVLGRMAAASAGMLPPVEPGLSGSRQSGMSMLAQGFESVWTELAERSVTDLRLGASVKRVDRTPRHDDNAAGTAIVVHYTQDGKADHVDCDFIIFAVPGRQALSLISDPAPHENEAFAHQIESKLVTTLIEGATNLSGRGLVYWPEHMTAGADDHVYAVRQASAILPGAGDGAEAYIVYQYYENSAHFDAGRSLQGLHRFLAQYATPEVTVRERREWDYFPRFTSEAIAAGVPWALIGKQGVGNTWFIGSSISFESVEAVMEFNHFMVDAATLNSRDSAVRHS